MEDKKHMKNFKNYIILALSVVAIVLSYDYFTQKVSSEKKNVMPQEVKDLVNSEVKRVNTKIDKEGFEHAVISETENTIRSAYSLDSQSKKELDSIIYQLGIKEKQLTQYVKYSTLLEGKLLEATKTDTGFTYADKWANIDYIKAKDSLSNGHFNFKYNAEVNYSEYWDKKHFLAKKKHYIDFWISDTRASINGVKRVKIEPKEKARFTIDATAQYIENPYIGGSVGIEKSRYKFSGGYLYNVESKKWVPSLKINYTIIDL